MNSPLIQCFQICITHWPSHPTTIYLIAMPTYFNSVKISVLQKNAADTLPLQC